MELFFFAHTISSKAEVWDRFAVPFLYMKRNKRQGRSSSAWRIIKAAFLTAAVSFTVLLLVGAVLIGVLLVSIDKQGDMAVMEMMRSSRTTRLYAPSGEVDRQSLTLENYIPEEVDILFGGENMVWAVSEEIPDTLRHAFVAIEDRGFYEHRGVEWGRTAYAALNQIFRFRPRFGGSTITQQLIKNVHGDKDISILRKAKEIVRALRLERVYTKDEILTYYLNIVPLGHGCVGVKSAARYYFGKELSELDIGECAALAAITNAPTRYDPIVRPTDNTARRQKVLHAMYDNRYLDREQYEAYRTAALQLNLTDPIYTDNRHNWYIETVVSDVIADLMNTLDISEGAAKTMLWRGGLEIYTLMDPRIQATMEDVFSDGDRLTDEDGTQIGAGMTICDPYSGDLLGIIGGGGEKTGTRLFNRATDGYYQPGSALKPLALYAPGIEWNLIHYATAFDDLPVETQAGYWPHNSPDLYLGRITAHEALARSKNTVAVELLRMLGERRIYNYLKDTVGLSALTHGGGVSDLAPAPLALGQLSYGTTVRELTTAYAGFANGGEQVRSRSYLAVFDAKGAPLLKNEQKNTRIWSRETAYIMTRMMCEVVEYSTARRITLKEVVDTAGKTGTSGEDRDKWFVGYTPYYVAGLHLAHDDRTALPAAERRHLTLWDEVMQRVHADVLPGEVFPRTFEIPEGIVEAEYCLDSGCIPTDACRGEIRGDRTAIGYFKVGDVPFEPCQAHVEAHFSLTEGQYALGAALEPTDIPFYVLSVPQRRIVTGIQPQDAPYTIEYLMQSEQELKEKPEEEGIE